jgi:hypothetical protein
MKSSLVHSVIAAGLQSPALLELWQREPERLRGCGVNPDEFDLERLWKFAGLSAKIRHNGLRVDLPLTFRFLSVSGIEIEVFAAYALHQAKTSESYAASVEARARQLLTFLADWLDLQRREHAILWDLFRYELALMQLSRRAGETSLVPRVGRSSRKSTCPRVHDSTILHEMCCHPQQVAEILQTSSPKIDEVTLDTFHFCFWRDGEASQIQILQLDELGFYLLTLADGTRSISEINRLIGGDGRPARGLLKAMRELARLGVISRETTRGQSQ